MTIQARTNLAVKLYSLLQAKFLNDSKYSERITEIGLDLRKMREEYESIIDYENWASEAQNQFNLFLDGIEYRLDQIVVLTKVIDNAPLQEMSVPE